MFFQIVCFTFVYNELRIIVTVALTLTFKLDNRNLPSSPKRKIPS